MFPSPNKNGVFSKDFSEEFCIGSDIACVLVYTLQVAENEWVSSLSYRIGDEGSSDGLARNRGVFSEKQEALQIRLDKFIEIAIRVIESKQYPDRKKKPWISIKKKLDTDKFTQLDLFKK